MKEKEAMIDKIEGDYGLSSPRVLAAMREIPREKFVPRGMRPLAYEDKAIYIGFNQTLSQPFTVAFMTHLLDLKGSEKVLEIGTGSGYQACLLGLLSREVVSIERISQLAKKAKARLKKLGFTNIKVKHGKGEEGWANEAPFDAILITAAVQKEVPLVLFNQLKKGGVLVSPVGGGIESIMTRYTKQGRGKVKKETFGKFNFVPLVEGR